MKILMVGDMVGSAGRNAFAQVVTRLKHEGKVDFVVANAENAAGGQGITTTLLGDVLNSGADVVTLGDHTWDQKDLLPCLDRESRVIRPLNFAPGCPGKGFVTVKTVWGDITVVNLIGRTFMRPYDCPFRAIDALLTKEPGLGKVILVDMHAEATSEKIVIGRYLDGRVSCVAGTHTHVQTSDETILPKGTAYVTDLGMTGGKDSALGRDLKSVTNMFLTGMPSKWDTAKNDAVLEGMIATIDETTGKAKSVKRIREFVS
jgi:2',3'-cyclic-nucleotide 2'-phosphodiesterase